MSMTKPVVGVSILMVMEEGKVKLSDPVSQFIPQFKDLKVAVSLPSPPSISLCTPGAYPCRAQVLYSPRQPGDHNP